jgi:hypothetical protein
MEQAVSLKRQQAHTIDSFVTRLNEAAFYGAVEGSEKRSGKRYETQGLLRDTTGHFNKGSITRKAAYK